MFRYIIEKDIELRLLEERHSTEDFQTIDKNREYLREWLPWVDDTRTVEDVRGFIKSCLEQFAHSGEITAGIWYRGRFAGVIGCYGLDSVHKKTAIGYWLSAEFTGHGIMTKACKAMIDYAFTELKVHRVEIRCAEGNYKSRAIPERLGFAQEGIIRQEEWLYDHYVNHVVYGMLDTEWTCS